VTFLTMLPMAVVMIAGPQILSAIFLATSENWRPNSIAYIAGAAISIMIVVSVAYFLGSGASDAGASDDVLYVVVLVLLLLAMLRTYLKREESAPPKWMGRLERRARGSRSGSGSCSSGCSQPTSSPQSRSVRTSRLMTSPGGTCCRSSG
jgi:Sap, sulfolipid-1-addressing protein